MNKIKIGKGKKYYNYNLFLVLLLIGTVCIINSIALMYQLLMSKNMKGLLAFSIIDIASIAILVVIGLRGWLVGERLKRSLDATIEVYGRSEAVIDYIMESTNSYIMFIDSNYKVISCSEALIKRLGYKDIWQIRKKSIYDVWDAVKNKETLEEIIKKVESTNLFDGIRVFEIEREEIWFSVNISRIRKEDSSEGFMIILTDLTKEQKSKKELVEIVNMRNKVLLTMSHELRTPINGINGSTELLAMSSQLSPTDKSHVQNIREACRALLSIVEQATDYNSIQNNEIVLENRAFTLNDILEEVRTLVHLRMYEKKIGFCVDIEPEIPSILSGDLEKICRVLLNLLYNAVEYTEEGYIRLSISKKEREGKTFIQYLVQDTGCGIEEENIKSLFDAFYRFEKKGENQKTGLGLGLSICFEFVKAMGGTIRCESRVNEGSTFWFEIQTEVLDSTPIAEVKNPFDKNIALVASTDWRIEQAKKMCRELEILSFKSCEDMEDLLNESFTHIVIDVAHPLATEILMTKFPFQCKKILILESSQNAIEGIREADYIVYEPFTITMLAQILNILDEEKEAEENTVNLVFKTKGVHALAVDDNAVNLMVVSNILQQYDIEVEEVDSGKVAIQRYYENEYDLIFMDYLMPDMDGVEATKNIRNLNKKVNPVIIALSANVNKEIKEKFEQAGADYVMAKPLELKELSHVLRRYLPSYKILEEKAIIQESKDQITFEALKSVLKEVDSLNLESGLVYMAGSVENYVRVLKVCCENVTEQINYIRAAYQLISISDLRIYFHSLKGIFLNVGAEKLSELSKMMEQASSNSNHEYIQENLESYIETVETFRNKLQMALGLYKNILASTIPEEKYQPMEPQEYKEKIEVLTESVKRFEFNESSELAEQLIVSSKGENRKLLEEVYEQIQQFQYDRAIELLEKIRFE